MARTRSKRSTGSGKRPTRGARRQKARQIAAAALAAATPEESAPQPITLEGFATLPHELKRYIIELACSPGTSLPRVKDCYTRDQYGAYNHAWMTLPLGPPAPRLDLNTALGLAFASKAFYGLMAPLLYSQVWLKRPSSLASFHLALATRPALGQLVKDLHVGPDDHELYSWNPVVQREGYRCWSCNTFHIVRPFITSSLTDPKDTELLPRGCHPRSGWALDKLEDSRRARSPRYKATFEALRAAQRYIDVDLLQTTRSFGDQPITPVEHTMRLCEVQAALDLYLAALRRWEDERKINMECIDDTRAVEETEGEGKYPTLILTGYAAATSAELSPSSVDVVVISFREIQRHLARPGCLMDDFNHPLIFARSGIHLSDISASCSGLLAPDQAAATASADLFSPSPSSSPDYGLSNMATLGSIFATLRAVVSYCPLINNLSLTGSLERAIWGSQTSDHTLKQLRFLNVGPLPSPHLPASLQLGSLAPLEELRICSMRLHGTEMYDLVTKLPRLQRLEWMVVGKCSSETMLSLERNISLLVGCGNAASASPQQRSETDTRSGGTAFLEDESDSLEESKHGYKHTSLPFIAIRMIKSDLELVLSRAPSPAVREAWTTGQALPNQQRRLQLSQSRERWLMKGDTNVQDAYLGGREWWFTRCAGRGGRGRR